MPAMDAIVSVISAADTLNAALAERVSQIVASLGDTPVQPERVEVIRSRVVNDIEEEIARIYGPSLSASRFSPMYVTIVAGRTLSIATAYTEFYDSFDRAMVREDAEAWSRIKSRLNAGGTGSQDRFARSWNIARGPEAVKQRYYTSGFFDPQRKWVSEDGYRLSDRVWKRGRETRRGIDRTIARGLRRGESPVTIARNLRTYLDPRLAPVRYDRNGRVLISLRGDPRAGSITSRTRVLARTEVSQAYRQATAHAVQEINISGAGVRWALSPAHPKIDICDDIASRSSDGYPRGVYLPNEFPATPHPQCVVEGTRVSGPSVRDAFHRWYDGDVVDICTEGGLRLSVTPNHPILTVNGWVDAGLVHHGHEVIYDVSAKRAVADRVPDDICDHPAIEQVCEAFSRSVGVTTVSVPSSAEQFHGDGSVDEDVDVVWSHRGLLPDVESIFREPFDQQGFGRTHPDLAILSRLGGGDLSLERYGIAPDRIVGGARHALPLVGGHERESALLRVSPTDDLDTAVAQYPGDDWPRGAEVGGDSFDRPPSRVGGDNVVSLGVDVVTSVVRRRYIGHVYNLHTSEHWYTANGIVTHNCLCSAQPWMPDRSEVLAQLLDRYGASPANTSLALP